MEKWSAWVDGQEITYQNDRPYRYWYAVINASILIGFCVGLLAWWIYR